MTAEPLADARDPSSRPNAVALHVADVLRGRIVHGQIRGGERIVERNVSAELDVSRTPVREALKLLEADGLIRISRNKGALVTRLTSDEALNLFEVSAALEGLAAARFATAAAPAALDQLEGLHERILFHYRRSQIEPYFDANTAAHDLIVKGCGNPVLTAHHRRIMLMARRGRYMAIMSPERWAQAVQEHEDLMQALRAGDPQAASTIWTKHLQQTGQTLAEVILAEETA